MVFQKSLSKLFFTLVVVGVVLGVRYQDIYAQGTPTTITVMTEVQEFTEAEIQAFNEANPDIYVEVIAKDDTRLQAMLAAGTPPDIIRISSGDIPSLVNRGVLRDLSSYFANSTAIREDDLAPVIESYRYEGGIYGMPKDWSPVSFLFLSKSAFEEAGIDIPDATERLTYTELFELSQQLTVREGDRTLQVGYVYDNSRVDRDIQRILAENGQHLYAEDFSSINLRDNPLAIEYLRFLYDLSQQNLTWNPLNPSPSWWGQDFLDGTAAMVTTGYWFSGMIVSNPESIVGDDVVFLPGPSWSEDSQIAPIADTIGWGITSASEHPDEAWRVFEYYMAGEPAQTRASSGWGIPALLSLYELMPAETPFQSQVQTVLQSELENANLVLESNPYYSTRVFNDSWNLNLEQALRGDITFEDLIGIVEDDVNVAIAEGMAIVNGE